MEARIIKCRGWAINLAREPFSEGRILQGATVYGKKSFLSKKSDTKILQSIYFAYEVGVISSYSLVLFYGSRSKSRLD